MTYLSRWATLASVTQPLATLVISLSVPESTRKKRDFENERDLQSAAVVVRKLKGCSPHRDTGLNPPSPV